MIGVELPDVDRWPAPDLGAQTDEILNQLGYDDAQRQRLRKDGII